VRSPGPAVTGPGRTGAGRCRPFAAVVDRFVPVRRHDASVTPEQIFWMAHDGLPREAPGSVDTTRQLLRLAGPLAPRPRVLDVGCGTGAASLVLAADTGGSVLAVDVHRPFLARLRAAAAEAGLGHRIHPVAASMFDLPVADGSIDLLWAEGSAYLMGFDAALAAWRRLLSPSGALVLTEAEWTTTTPATGARAFWQTGYPVMRALDGNARAALDRGWRVLATYQLPESDWAGYYDPLARRLDVLRARGVDPAALDEVGREIDIWRRHGADYGYTGFVLRPR
jgi:SAM-dependent methyltransferase